jgi:arylsulfatase
MPNHGTINTVLKFFSAALLVGTVGVILLVTYTSSSHSRSALISDYSYHYDNYTSIMNIPILINITLPTAATTTYAREEEESEPKRDEEENKNNDKPLNIVFLYADDWSYTTLGAMGNDFVKTPNLDQMAKDGILFTHSCVTTSICMISRASLYTGQYASNHKTLFANKDVTMYEPTKWNQTLYPLLKQNGYHTGFYGKWHHSTPPKNTHSDSKIYAHRHWIERDGILQHVTQLNEDDAMEYLKEKRPTDGKTPFALSVSFYATHALDGNAERYQPMNSSMSWYENEYVPNFPTHTNGHWKRMPYFFNGSNYGRGRYNTRYTPADRYQTMMKNTYRMATEVDAAVGRIINEIKKQNLLNDTLIIFTTDNGNFHGQHGLAEKWYAYEESIRVPLIVMDPRLPPSQRGIRNDDFVLNIDLAPTILSAAKIPIPNVMQGRDFSELYLSSTSSSSSESNSSSNMNKNKNKKQEWRNEFYYEWPDPKNDKYGVPENNALVRKDGKYIVWPEHENYEQFFNLTEDPIEEMDIINETIIQQFVLPVWRKRMFELQQMAINGQPM